MAKRTDTESIEEAMNAAIRYLRSLCSDRPPVHDRIEVGELIHRLTDARDDLKAKKMDR